MTTILVVEDEGSIASMLVMLLELEGYSVAHTRDGQAALEFLTTVRPNLILCDVMMPRLAGPAFVVALRARAEFRSIPVIMMSAGLDDLDGLAGMIHGFVRKPFVIDELVNLVSKVLAERPDSCQAGGGP